MTEMLVCVSVCLKKTTLICFIAVKEEDKNGEEEKEQKLSSDCIKIVTRLSTACQSTDRLFDFIYIFPTHSKCEWTSNEIELYVNA